MWKCIIIISMAQPGWSRLVWRLFDEMKNREIRYVYEWKWKASFVLLEYHICSWGGGKKEILGFKIFMLSYGSVLIDATSFTVSFVRPRRDVVETTIVPLFFFHLICIRKHMTSSSVFVYLCRSHPVWWNLSCPLPFLFHRSGVIWLITVFDFNQNPIDRILIIII